MEFSVLGPVEVRADGRAVSLGGVKPRALLAVLLLHPNEPVSAERLALALWGEEAPPSAVKTVQVYMSRLRRALGNADVLTSTHAGYRVRVRSGELDAERFEQRVVDGRRALAAHDAERAAALLDEALGLWRGPPLAELAAVPFAPAAIARLEEQRLVALELRVEADLAAGRHAELVPELQQLTHEHPWRERLHAQLMLALYGSGRQADALEAYRKAREVLVEQLGIEPGGELAGLQQAILAQDPSIGALPRSAGMGSQPRGRGLPVPPNRTVGRGDELTAIAGRLQASSVRLLTLVGPGGVGKTRLALEAARVVEADFADGAHFVSLAPLKRPEDVAAAIVRALGIVVLPGESPEQAIARFLAAKHLLLVADNCEHVLDAAPLVGGLLEVCPGVTVLATSREPLGLQAEQRHAVPPLARPAAGRPGDLQTLAGVAAVELFSERACGHDPQFELGDGNVVAVADICRRLDGLPLAIELAAARCALLSPQEIAERLDAALAALGGGARDAPARQRTLRATIDWSHELLDDEEKACFARFAVLAGGATVDAAEAITGADLDTLDRLVAKSLLVRRPQSGGHSRLLMLETVRAYAVERLAAAPDGEAIRERHYRYFLGHARRHGDERALSRADRSIHVAYLDDEIDNLREALAWSVARPDAEPALALTAALAWYWLWRNRYTEALDWIDRALALPGADANPVSLVATLRCKVWLLWPVGRGSDQPAAVSEAEVAARRSCDPVTIAQALVTSADYASGNAGRPELAAALADEALEWATKAGDEWEIASAVRARARGASSTTDLRERVDRAAAHLHRVGNMFQLADLLTSAAYSALCGGDDDDAREYVERAIPVVRALEDGFMWMILIGNRGLAALFTGDRQTASSAFREQLEIARELVVRPIASEGLLGLAGLAAAGGKPVRAARLRGAAKANSYDQRQDEIEARIEAAFVRQARLGCGADEWDRAVIEGAGMSFEDAIAYALEETERHVPAT